MLKVRHCLSAYRVEIALFVLLIPLALVQLDSVPPAWFDEGWSLSLARNWVERGHYGHLFLGQPVPSTILNAGLPMLAPIALSFRLLGVGLWQGRLPGALLALASLGLLYRLTSHLYQRRTALVTLGIVLGLSVHPHMNPLFMGRYAMGEIYVIFYVLVGYLSFWKGWEAWPYLALSAVAWGAALQTKPQAAPFLVLALALPAGLAWIQRQPRVAWRLSAALVGTLGVSWAIRRFEIGVLNGGNDPYQALQNLDVLFTYVLSLNIKSRIFALTSLALLIGTLQLFGLVYVAGKWLKSHSHLPMLHERTLVLKSSLWIFGASWYLWYVGFSIGWPRYLYPAAMVVSFFAAHMLDELTEGFNLRASLEQGSAIFKRPLVLKAWALTGLFILVLSAAVLSLKYLLGEFARSDASLYEVAWFLNQDADPNAVSEVYDSELYFLLDRPYHYPPNEVQHQLNQRFFFGASIPITYNPLTEVKIAYLVVGDMTRFWGFDQVLLADPAWHLVLNTGLYQVYARIP